MKVWIAHKAVDVELAERVAELAREAGHEAKLKCFERFPIVLDLVYTIIPLHQNGWAPLVWLIREDERNRSWVQMESHQQAYVCGAWSFVWTTHEDGTVTSPFNDETITGTVDEVANGILRPFSGSTSELRTLEPSTPDDED